MAWQSPQCGRQTISPYLTSHRHSYNSECWNCPHRLALCVTAAWPERACLSLTWNKTDHDITFCSATPVAHRSEKSAGIFSPQSKVNWFRGSLQAWPSMQHTLHWNVYSTNRDSAHTISTEGWSAAVHYAALKCRARSVFVSKCVGQNCCQARSPVSCAWCRVCRRGRSLHSEPPRCRDWAGRVSSSAGSSTPTKETWPAEIPAGNQESTDLS